MASRDRGGRENPAGGQKKGEITEKVGLPGLQAAIADDGGVSHSEAEKGELSLPDRAADAAPSSIHMAAGPVQGAVDGCKAFPAQLDWLHASSGERRTDPMDKGAAS